MILCIALSPHGNDTVWFNPKTEINKYIKTGSLFGTS